MLQLPKVNSGDELCRHPRESGDPVCKPVFISVFKNWIPAFAGMTNSVAGSRILTINHTLFFVFGFFLSFVAVHSVQCADLDRKVQKKAWSILRESLTSSDSTVREQVVQGLEFVPGEMSINSLKSSLEDESEYVQIWAARSLINRGDPSGKNVLKSLVLNTQETANKSLTGPLAALAKMKALARGKLRGEAAKVMGLFKGDSEVMGLLRNLKRDNDGRVRDGAAIALGLLGDSSETIVFASAVKDPDKGIRLAAVEALAAMKDLKGESALIMMLNDPEENIRHTAARGLGAMKSTNAINGLKGLFSDPSGLVKESAVWALGEIGNRDVVPILRSALNDPNVFVQIMAAESLGKVGNSSGLTICEAALNSNDMDARARAAVALGAIKDNKTKSLAIKTLDDTNLKVRLGAALSLFKMENGQDQ